MSPNESVKLLMNRCDLALGSLALVEKQLLDIRTALTVTEKFVILTEQGEEENSDSEFFISPPLSVYDTEVD